MNKKINYIVLLLFTFMLMQGGLLADKHKDYQFPPYSGAVTHTFMQPNNLNYTIISDGVFGIDRINFSALEAGTIWPVTSVSRKTINFGSGLWVGARVIMPDNSKDLRVAAAVYESHYSPGNIPVVGQVPPNTVCQDPRLKTYHVQLVDPNFVNGGSRVVIAGGREYTQNFDAWANWPVDLGAPYVEVNNIPGYQPAYDGDRPGIGNSEARPDEITFVIYMDYKNCTNAIHTSQLSHPGNSLPLGVEIHQLSFGFNSPGLTNMHFMKWTVINKSGRVWDSTYISVFDDPDVGNAFDDNAACDSTRSIGICYNNDNLDPDYGAAPPAFGYKYLQSPVVPDPNGVVYLPYDTLYGFRALGLSSFVVYKNGGGVCDGDPDDRIPGYNFMSGKDGCGAPIRNWVTNNPTQYMYSTYSDTTNQGCNRGNWYDSVGQDRRFLQSSGPFTMNSLDTQIIVVGAFVGRGSDNLQSVCVLLGVANRVQRIYNLNFRSIPLPPPPQVKSVALGDGKITLYWDATPESYHVFDAIDLTGYWDFQGYEIYQIKPGTGGEDPSERSLLAIYDVIDSISTVFDTVEVLQPNGLTLEEVRPTALGSNSGIQRFMVLTQNKYPVGVNNFFVNGQTYRFAVLAYGVNRNALKPAKVLKNSIASQIISVTPNLPVMGTEFVNKNLDTLVSNRIDRGFMPVVIDPAKVKQARYQMVWRSNTSWSIVRIISNSQVDTLARNSTNISRLDNNAYIFDGLLFKADTISKANYGVIRDKTPTTQTSATGWTYSGSSRNLAGVDTTGINAIHPTGNFKGMQNNSMGISWPSGITFKDGFVSKIDTGTFLKSYSLKNIKITFGETQKAYRYLGAINNSPLATTDRYVDVPFKVEIDDPLDTLGPPRQVNIGFYDYDSSGTWNPKATQDGGLEYVYIFYSTYSPDVNLFYNKNIAFRPLFGQLDVQYVWWPRLLNGGAPAYQNGDVFRFYAYTQYKMFQTPGWVTIAEVNTTAPTIGSIELASQRNEMEQVRVVPNPYYGGHSQETSPFDRFVKFMNLPKTVTIYIYSLNGNLVRQLSKDNESTSLNWDLLNTDRIPVASGIYIAYIEAPGIGNKIIKIAVFTPEERLDSF